MGYLVERVNGAGWCVGPTNGKFGSSEVWGVLLGLKRKENYVTKAPLNPQPSCLLLMSAHKLTTRLRLKKK